MTLRAVAILAVFIVGMPAEAGLRRECRRKCKQAIAACVTNTAQRRRKCRRLTLRQCRREGIAVCVPPTMTITSTTTTSTTTRTTLQAGCFQDWGDGTIRDTCTGLQWEKKNASDGTPNAANLHDVDNPYSWVGCCKGDCTSPANFCQPDAAAAATCTALSDGGTTGCSTCESGTCNVDPRGYGAITTVWDWLNQVNAVNFAEHSDWRLPSEEGCNLCPPGAGFSCSQCDPHELETILLAPYPCGTSPCIDPIFGPTAVSYWSASTDAADPVNAWIVAGGAMFAYAKSIPVVYPFEAINVRAVR